MSQKTRRGVCRWTCSLAVVLLAVQLMLGSCHRSSHGNPPPGSVGVASLRLEARSESGVAYRLAGEFDIAGMSNLTLSTDDYPGQSVINQALAVGDYTVTLVAGWQLLRETSNGDVPASNAVLLSPSVQAFTIVKGQVTLVAFSFEVDGQPVSTGGTLEISIDVTERVPDAGGWDSGDSDGAGGSVLPGLREIATLPPTAGISVHHVEALRLLGSDPTTLLIVTQNLGSYCGGGTPAAVWKLQLDPSTGLGTSLEFRQSLDRIQMVRQSLFESSDGTLFTGSGQCGSKPPYYSSNQGLTFLPATNGVYPPNSSFTYVEFQNQVYVGTGYAPYDGEVYRWIGNGGWTRVLDIPSPRGFIESMVVYQDRMFVASNTYGRSTDGCETSVPVYVSSDGSSFLPTFGIPNCQSVTVVIAAGSRLFALDGTSVYGWNATQSVWASLGSFPFTSWVTSATMVARGDALYAYGTVTGDTSPGIYSSINGVSWGLVVAVPGPVVQTLSVQKGTLYAGTNADSSGTAHIYSVSGLPPL